MLTIGFTLSFGALFSKTWRVYKIFTAAKSMERVVSATCYYCYHQPLLKLLTVEGVTLTPSKETAHEVIRDIVLP